MLALASGNIDLVCGVKQVTFLEVGVIETFLFCVVGV